MKIAKGINDYNDYNKPFKVEVETNDEIKDISQALKRLLIKKSEDK